MNKKTTGYISIMLVALVLGVMLAVQFRAVSRPPVEPSAARSEGIVDELRQTSREIEGLNKEISDLKGKLEKVNLSKSDTINVLKSELAKARMVAGLTTVIGPGVEVVLDNPDRSGGGRLPPGVYVPNISAEDLLKTVNKLWGADAEALFINGQRIIATTEIRLAGDFTGDFININTQRVVPPYQILAIGDPGSLAKILEEQGGLADYFRYRGIEVTVAKHEELTIPAYTGD